MGLIRIDPSEVPEEIRRKITEPVENLLQFAKEQGVRVTSGFSRGGHNKGSMHYQGSEDDPGAIDVDHRTIKDVDKFIAEAQARGYNVRDERVKPKGQAVWGGPHIHLSKGGKKSPAPSNNPPSQQQQAVIVSDPLRPIDLNEFGMGRIPGIDLNQALLQVRQAQFDADTALQVKTPQPKAPSQAPPPHGMVRVNPEDVPEEIRNKIKNPVQVIEQRTVESLNRQAPPPQQGGFVSDLSNNFQNAISGFTRDDLVKQSGNGWGAGLGTIGGSLLGIGGSALAGAGLGSIVPGAGTVGGALAGTVAGGTSVGALQEAQRLRLQPDFDGYGLGDVGKIAGAGLIGGVTSLPVGGAASTVGRTILKNAAIDAGINAGGDVALQAVEQGSIDPRRLDIGRTLTSAGIGAAGGGIAGSIHAKLKGVAPQIADKIDQGIQLTEAETRVVISALTPEELASVNESWRQRTVGEPKEIITQPFSEQQAALDIGLRKPVTEQVSDTGLTVTREGATKQIPDIAAPGQPFKVLGEGLDLGLARAPSEPGLMNAQGRAMSESPLDLLGATGRPLDLGIIPDSSPTKAITSPSSDAASPGSNIHTRPEGGQVYTQGRAVEDVERIAAALEKNSQLLELENAKKLLADKQKVGLLTPEEFRTQSDILNLFEEAGRTGKTFDSMRREIQEGMGRISQELGKSEVKQRDSLAPFAITVKQRKPQTEVSNLVRRLGSDEAARDTLRQMAGRYGITPTTQGRTVKANARKIAEQIAHHPQGRLAFTDIYLNAHNFKTGGERTLTDAPRAYPLRTFVSANIGTEQAVIPQGALSQNAIAQQFETLEQIKNTPDVSPEVKQAVTKVTDNPNVSFKDIRKMRQLVSQSLEKFCSIWGLK